MLSSSVHALGHTVDLLAVTDRNVDPRLHGGIELLNFVDAVLGGSASEISVARSALRSALGWEATVDAAGVIGNFEMMNRIADATGMPVGKGRRRTSADMIDRLGLARFDHAAED